MVKDAIAKSHNVSVLDDSVEGILWVQISDKQDHFKVNVCVCYLPPYGSSRQCDVFDFYDDLLTMIYLYQNDGMFYVCGDFNSRCGNGIDFMEGIDHIPHREILDFKMNSYGEVLLDFLIQANCCIVNGRHCKKND